MARHPRNGSRQQARPKPITEHQLFPAVVALWFGALFGLGSLAVRASLLESLVIRSRIDLVIPAAAPPLGVTARAFLALVLAAIGCMIGIAIARRLARPKPQVRERKRSTLATHDPVPVRGYAPAEEHQHQDEPQVTVQRRRALAIDNEEREFVPYEIAPLPGGAPQVLDISSMGFKPEPAEAPLDLGSYSAPPATFADPAPSAIRAAQSEPARQEFQLPQDQSAIPVNFDPAAASEVAAAAADGRQVFGLPAQEPIEPEPRQIFGQPIENGHVPEDFVKAAGYQTTVFDKPEASPLFVRNADQTVGAEVEPAARVQTFEVPEAPAVPAFTVPPSQFVADAEHRMALPVATDAVPAIQPPTAEPVAAQSEPPLPSPAGLGMTDLASRLAESMARRRAARGGTAYAAPAAASEPVQAAEVAQAAPAFTAEAVVAVPQSEPSPAAAAVQVFASNSPTSFAPPPAEAPASTEAVPPMPAAFAPQTPRFTTEAAPVVAPEPAQVSAIPAAMRPLDLDGFEDLDEPLGDFLPPRHIAMPAPAAPLMPQTFQPPADEAEPAEAEVAEDNYASLLGIAPSAAAPANGFVRIDDADDDPAAIEPVVIFPGQMIRQDNQPDPAAAFRRFDAPESAGQGQPIAASDAAPAADREESERALRMALANLQRMSGAA